MITHGRFYKKKKKEKKRIDNIQKII